MRMSTRGRFGLRALIHLAAHTDGEPVAVSEIADEMEVSPDYLMQLFVRMRRGCLLESVRGPNGGFRFARNLDKITIGDVIRCVEGPLSPVDCIPEDPAGCVREFDDGDVCAKAPKCVSRIAWLNITEEIIEIFDSTTIYDIINNKA
jgi:Rrf2 family cysteine metabolism transcriptional repressor